MCKQVGTGGGKFQVKGKVLKTVVGDCCVGFETLRKKQDVAEMKMLRFCSWSDQK